MTRIRMALVLTLFVALGSGCNPASTIDNENNGVTPLQPVARISLICDETSRRGQWVAESGAILVGTASANTICIDDTETVSFSPGFAQIRVFKDTRAAIDLRCDNDSTQMEFYSRVAGRQVGLLAGDSLIGLFSTTSPIDGVPCGRIETQAFETAISICEVLALKWGQDPGECLEPCDGSRSICVQLPPRALSNQERDQ